MGLQIKISAESDCSSIFVYETTGSYQECCNDTGFGDPNLRDTDITSSKLIIKGPTMVSPVEIDMTGTFPNADGIGFEILPSDIGLTKIESGIYTIERVDTYETSDGSIEEFRAKRYFLFYECVECCVNKGALSVNLGNIDTAQSVRATRAVTLFDQMKRSASNGQWQDADKIAEYLRNQCDCCL
jgi:hypothetical protein